MKEKKCPVCEGKLIEVDNIILDLDNYIFVVNGERCEKCREEFPFEAETQKMIKTSRKLGVWPEPLKLHRTLSKSGGTLMLRIPLDLEKQMNLKSGENITLSKVGNKIVIEPF